MRTNLELLLSDWGRRQDIERDRALGYPSQAAFAKERVDHDAYGYSGPEALLPDADILRLDKAINSLHPDGRVIIVYHYVVSGPVKAKHDKLGLSRAAYYFRLEAAHLQLSHSLGGRYATGYEPILSRQVEEVSRAI